MAVVTGAEDPEGEARRINSTLRLKSGFEFTVRENQGGALLFGYLLPVELIYFLLLWPNKDLRVENLKGGWAGDSMTTMTISILEETKPERKD
jgi:hypothetical protein